MKATNGREVRGAPDQSVHRSLVPGLDEQFCQLIEAVYESERRWRLEDSIDAAIRYGGAAKWPKE